MENQQRPGSPGLGLDLRRVRIRTLSCAAFLCGG